MHLLSTLLAVLILLPSYADASWANSLTPRFLKRKNTEIVKPQEFVVSPQCMVEITNTKGPITIKTWNHDRVLLEVTKNGTEEELKATTFGITQNESALFITTKVQEKVPAASISYTLMVPQDASVRATLTQEGDVTVKQLRGSVQATTHNGSITIADATNTVIAKSNYGSIRIRQKSLVEPHTIFVEAINGNVHLSLPKKVNASLRLNTMNGVITSLQPVTLDPLTTVLNKDAWNNFKKQVRGTVGNGKNGAPIIIDVSRGNIILDEY